jgi:hypothetical protein
MTEIPQQTPAPPGGADDPLDTPPDDPRRPVPFVPDEGDAPRDPDTGDVSIDEPDPAPPGPGR